VAVCCESWLANKNVSNHTAMNRRPPDVWAVFLSQDARRWSTITVANRRLHSSSQSMSEMGIFRQLTYRTGSLYSFAGLDEILRIDFIP
jgi:hypothetical protein